MSAKLDTRFSYQCFLEDYTVVANGNSLVSHINMHGRMQTLMQTTIMPEFLRPAETFAQLGSDTCTVLSAQVCFPKLWTVARSEYDCSDCHPAAH